MSSTCAGTGLLVSSAVNPVALWADVGSQSLAPYLTGLRMAATPATAYRAYRSKVAANPDVKTWVQIDLGKSVPIDAIRLFPASERMYPGRDQYYAGEGFPLRFVIEAADDEALSAALVIADFRNSDFPDPWDNITDYSVLGAHGRYVRLTATRLRPVKANPSNEIPPGEDPPNSPDYTLTLAKIAVLSHGTDVAIGCKVSADVELGNKELRSQLTRPYRQDGEDLRVPRSEGMRIKRPIVFLRFWTGPALIE
jgi:hypothetical protein